MWRLPVSQVWYYEGDSTSLVLSLLSILPIVAGPLALGAAAACQNRTLFALFWVIALELAVHSVLVHSRDSSLDGPDLHTQLSFCITSWVWYRVPFGHRRFPKLRNYLSTFTAFVGMKWNKRAPSLTKKVESLHNLLIAFSRLKAHASRIQLRAALMLALSLLVGWGRIYNGHQSGRSVAEAALIGVVTETLHALTMWPATIAHRSTIVLDILRWPFE